MTSATASANALYEKHKEAIDKAISAIHDRKFYAQYLEAPSKKVYGETGNEDGLAAFKQQWGKPFSLLQSSDTTVTAAEESPYTGEKLGISYPACKSPATYISNANTAFEGWRKASAHTRAGILFESLDRIATRFFEMTFATMHTTGQSWIMSFQASGPHSNDRALEAIALGLQEQTRFPENVDWVKPMGRDKDGNPMSVHLRKKFLNVPLGIGLCIGCSTFPVWNTTPAIYADLVTGNTVIVKPHPMAIYPIAIVVDEIQKVLKENGFDPNVIQLAPDTPDAPVTKVLAEDPSVKIIDYTGSNMFGDYLESLPGKRTFTEKAGINSIVLHSTNNVKAMMQNISFSLSLYSGQMCTCPQNIFIPKDGIDTPDGKLSYEDAVKALATSIEKLVTHEKMGPGTLGAIQNPNTAERVKMAQNMGLRVVQASLPVTNPEFPNCRIATPAVMEVTPDKKDILGREMFGPIVYVIPVDDYKQGVQLARELATEHGAITFSAWCTDPDVMDYMTDEMARSFTSVSFNFVGPIWVNQSAGFSDFHVTGGNPAGNASLTDPEFVLGRFEIVGVRIHD